MRWMIYSMVSAVMYSGVLIHAGQNNVPVVDAGNDQVALPVDNQRSWSPADLSIHSWYDAADASTLETTGGKVAKWSDKSGNGHHAVQRKDVFRPLFGTRKIHGNSVIEFDQTKEQHMEVPKVDVIGKEVWAVFSIDSFQSSATELLLGGKKGNNQIGVQCETKSLRLWCGKNPYSQDTVSSANVPENKPFIAGWRAHKPFKRFSLNGEQETTADKFVEGSLIVDAIGRGQYTYLDGSVAELMIVNGELSDLESRKMEGYLAHKWGLQNDLPVDHPYRTTSPAGAGGEVMINAIVSDSDGDELKIQWMKVSGPGPVHFSDARSANTKVTFDVYGSYVLRLTADDGQQQGHDDVLVRYTSRQTFDDWVRDYNVGGKVSPLDDHDKDGLPNLVENYFGTDPSKASPGLSALSASESGASTFRFTHPINNDPALGYAATYRWSRDGAVFYQGGESDENGTMVEFEVDEYVNGNVVVSAKISGPEPENLYVDVAVVEE